MATKLAKLAKLDPIVQALEAVYPSSSLQACIGDAFTIARHQA